MTPVIVIPARMAATRLPGKPLALIDGLPMVVHTLRRAEASGVGPVLVAAGDREIVDAVNAAGGRAVLTDPDLPSGSDRVLAALAEVDPGRRFDAVINLQGDMPFADPGIVTACAGLLAARGCDISTVVAPEASAEDRDNPDVVKAVLALDADARSGRCLYFTRSRLYGDGPVWRHVGVYGYRRDALERFNALPPSPLERREKLEQLRALEAGMNIHAAIAQHAPISVDTAADLENVRRAAVHQPPA